MKFRAEIDRSVIGVISDQFVNRWSKSFRNASIIGARPRLPVEPPKVTIKTHASLLIRRLKRVLNTAGIETQREGGGRKGEEEGGKSRLLRTFLGRCLPRLLFCSSTTPRVASLYHLRTLYPSSLLPSLPSPFFCSAARTSSHAERNRAAERGGDVRVTPPPPCASYKILVRCGRSRYAARCSTRINIHKDP